MVRLWVWQLKHFNTRRWQTHSIWSIFEGSAATLLLFSFLITLSADVSLDDCDFLCNTEENDHYSIEFGLPSFLLFLKLIKNLNEFTCVDLWRISPLKASILWPEKVTKEQTLKMLFISPSNSSVLTLPSLHLSLSCLAYKSDRRWTAS